MKSFGVVLIAAATPRSLKYLTSMIKKNHTLEEVLILDHNGLLPGQRKEDGGGKMSFRLREICNQNDIKVSHHSSDVNSFSLISKVKSCKSKLVIYSGYGGQIIKQKVLNTGKKILHIHSGILPKYRGSTTIYYAILNKENCGVTAIILDNNIDTGTIVGSKVFPSPKPGNDIDFKFDIDYRTELLIEVVSYYQVNGNFKSETIQSHDKGKMYYIAHPVLRHIAMLRGTS